jgi:hypothetical protein
VGVVGGEVLLSEESSVPLVGVVGGEVLLSEESSVPLVGVVGGDEAVSVAGALGVPAPVTALTLLTRSSTESATACVASFIGFRLSGDLRSVLEPLSLSRVPAHVQSGIVTTRAAVRVGRSLDS